MNIIFILMIIIILVSLLFLPVKIHISYLNGETKLVAYIAFIKIPVFKKKNGKRTENKKSFDDVIKNEAELSKKTISFSEKVKKFVGVFTHTARLTKKYVTVEKFDINVICGTGDAASSAVSVGILWGVIYNAIALLGTIFLFDTPKVKVSPDYNNTVFKADASCILSSRIVYIIIIAISSRRCLHPLREPTESKTDNVARDKNTQFPAQ